MSETPLKNSEELKTIIVLVFNSFCRVCHSEESMTKYLENYEGKETLKEGYKFLTAGNFEEKSIEIHHLQEFLTKGSYKILEYHNYLPFSTKLKENNIH